jgi:hypothetical protein
VRLPTFGNWPSHLISSRSQAEIALDDSTRLHSKNFWILPVEVFGNGAEYNRDRRLQIHVAHLVG